jgi:hypothetical protein
MRNVGFAGVLDMKFVVGAGEAGKQSVKAVMETEKLLYMS